MLHLNWMRRQRMLGFLFIAPNMIGVTIFFFIPALFSLVLSFTDWDFVSRNANFVGFSNYSRLFGEEVFYQSLINTLIFLCSVPISITLAFLVALALNKSVYLKNTLRAMYFLPYITSGVAVAFVWGLLFDPQKGPINQLLRTIGISNPPGWFSNTVTPMYAFDIIWIWFMLGFNMIIILTALQDIPGELLEAAKIDGATSVQLTVRIVVPLVSPTLFFLLVTGFIMNIKTFGIIEAITHGGPGTSSHILSLFAYKTAFRYYEMGYAASISWIIFLIMIAITLFQWYGLKKWVNY
jgi:multiple sugar transport system permease protein